MIFGKNHVSWRDLGEVTMWPDKWGMCIRKRVTMWHIDMTRGTTQAHDLLDFPSYLNPINSNLGFIISLYHSKTSKTLTLIPLGGPWLILMVLVLFEWGIRRISVRIKQQQLLIVDITFLTICKGSSLYLYGLFS